MDKRPSSFAIDIRRFPFHGWIGLVLIAIFWPLNWFLPGLRTNWAFFPLWLGYSLTMDGLVFVRRGSSLFQRSWKRYLELFFISMLGWWLFEVLNERVQNWSYIGISIFAQPIYLLEATISFSTVIPAVFGASEFIASFNFIRWMKKGPIISQDRKTTLFFFSAGVAMLGLMLIWPRYFFAFMWLSVFFMLEPFNVWLGNRSLTDFTKNGDWRPIISLFLGVLMTGFFWEMWNFYSYPKWIYTVPFVNFGHIFEMPLLGYLGYLPFSLELYSLYHFIMGLFGSKHSGYLQVSPDNSSPDRITAEG
ncbi:MAG TPA: hypothetical protein VKF38_11770 [Anaerolineaceae bacterium]|nr:hypothetical protein [Anaerolineaceae bacterium]